MSTAPVPPYDLAAYDQGYADGHSHGLWWGLFLGIASIGVLCGLALIVWRLVS